jgi:hypothetical protein
MAILFFDIGGTLADVAVTDGGLLFTPLPRVVETLDALPDVRKGIVSNPGDDPADRARAEAALDATFGKYFTERSLINWGAKDSAAVFTAAAARAGVAASECVFVGEDASERRHAADAGMTVAPHPVFALAALQRRAVFWARIVLPAGRTLAELAALAAGIEFVPVHIPSDKLVLGLSTEDAAAALAQQGFAVDLRSQAGDTNAYLMRDDRALAPVAALAAVSAGDRQGIDAKRRAASAFAYVSGALAGFGNAVVSLGAAPGGVYLAASAGAPIEEIHIPDTGHGHTERLLPDPSLLHRPGEAQLGGFLAGPPPGPAGDAVHQLLRQHLTADTMRGHIGRLAGAVPLRHDTDDKVTSRHIESRDNARVVDYLAGRFRDLGLAVRRQEFSFRGRRLFNVEAAFHVAGADAVLITAHLDSTAAEGEFFTPDGEPRQYDPASDPAPGADDDGSGVAALLGTAECLNRLVAAGHAPRRSVRLVAFNAEEQGLIGSKSYARAAAAAGDRIAAVLQMDMIGGLQGGARKVEIHAGTGVAGPVVEASQRLAALTADAVHAISPDLEVQLLSGPDDPAAGRSDHASFHERGWAAVVMSENFFTDTEPASGTRQYHKPGDRLDDPDLDTDYAAGIARAVALAGLGLAGL